MHRAILFFVVSTAALQIVSASSSSNLELRKRLLKLFYKRAFDEDSFLDVSKRAVNTIFTEAGVPCVFPFTYQGQQHSDCIQGASKKWCAISDPNFDSAGDWDYCLPPISERPVLTNSGKKCMFPFTYKGKEYKTCVSAGSHTWCYTDKDGNYDNCVIYPKPELPKNIYDRKHPTPSSGCGLKPSSFKPEEKQKLVDLHNAFRAKEPATYMRKLHWNEHLASRAQYFAETCPDDHGETNSCWGENASMGQNMVRSFGVNDYSVSSVEKLFENWGPLEQKYYNVDKNTCSRVCGHYTQVVWANSNEIGCGRAMCKSKVAGDKTPYKTVSICNYFPAGNMNGARPYIKGEKGTGCADASYPHDYKLDSEGFCEYCPDGGKGCKKQELCRDLNANDCPTLSSYCEKKDELVSTWDFYKIVHQSCRKTCDLCNEPPEFNRMGAAF